MTLRNVIPIILSVILISLIILLMAIRIEHQKMWGSSFINLDFLFIVTYIMWIIKESMVSKDEIHKDDKTSDYGTCELYAIGQAAVILSALWLTPVQGSLDTIHIIGFIIFLGGIALRLFAIKTLGKYYSHIVREIDNHEIIDSGPYNFIRHPAYSGMILANLGIVVFFFNLITLTLFCLVLLPAIVLRILIEEKTLYKIDKYSMYAKVRKRLLPGIW